MSITIKTYDIPQESRNGRIYTNGSTTSSSSSSSVSVGGITDLSNYYTSMQTDSIVSTEASIRTSADSSLASSISTRISVDNSLATALSLQSISGTTLVDRTYLGYQAGKNFSGNTNSNCFIGAGSGFANVGGYCNTYIGHNCAYNNNGSRNVFIGYNSATGLTNVSDTLYINNSYGYTDTPLIYGGFYLAGFQDAFLKVNGKLYLPSLPTATQTYVLYYNPATSEITRGSASGSALIGTTNYYNTFLGQDAGRVASSTGYNTLIGFNASYNTTGSAFYNTVIGQDANYNCVSGSSNVIIGYNSGRYNTDSNCLYIDNQSRTNETTQKLYSLIYGKFSSLPANQTLQINGNLFVNGMSADATPTNIVYYNTTTKKMTYGAVPTGTITTVSAGNGMNFSTITNSGSIILGTPSSITTSSTNNVSAGSHSHSISGFLALSGGTLTGGLTGTTAYFSSNVVVNGTLAANLSSAVKTSMVYYNTTSKEFSFGVVPIQLTGLTEGGTLGATMLGVGAGNVSTGAYDTYIGYNAGTSNTTGYKNTFVGAEAGLLNTSGLKNTFIGANNGDNNTTGFKNTFVGADCGTSNSTGGDNTFFGQFAGYSNTSGSGNTYLGNYSGNNNITGYNNVCIGYNAGYSETGSNKLYISNSSTSTPLIKGDFAANNVTINGTLLTKNLKYMGEISGYTTTSEGVIIQWGRFSSNSDNDIYVYFCIPFPHYCLTVVTNEWYSDLDVTISSSYFISNRCDTVGTTQNRRYIAIGY